VSDDPRGHDDGDIVVALEERQRWLNALIDAYIIDLNQTQGYSHDELVAAVAHAAALLRQRKSA
jgi:hypothetical protein